MRWLPAFALLLSACAASEVPPAERTVEVTGTDYAFTVPDSLPAGRTTFRFVNNGKVGHELNITRLKPGVRIEELLAAARAGRSVSDLTEGAVGVLFADPGGGRSATGLAVDMQPGERYAVVCIFVDSGDTRRHYDLGMYAVVEVTGPPPARLASGPAVDTIVATDYAFQYPRTVNPGKHVFFMANAGKQRHQLAMELLKQGVTIDSLLKVGAAGGDVNALIEGTSGLVHARAGEKSLGGLVVDMLPGREYAIACFVQDDENSPEHVALGMYGSIRADSTGADDD